MKPAHARFIGIFLFLLGLFFLIGSSINITGAAVGLTSYTSSLISIFGIIFMLASMLLLFNAKNLEEKIRLHTKEELSNLTPKQRTFRKKLTNLLDLQKPIDPKKIAYLLPQYDQVKDTGEHIPKHNYKVYRGRRGSREEYFTVDTRETAPVRFGNETRYLPVHIDIQERIGTNRYVKREKEDIDWERMIHESKAEDIIMHFREKSKRKH